MKINIYDSEYCKQCYWLHRERNNEPECRCENIFDLHIEGSDISRCLSFEDKEKV